MTRSFSDENGIRWKAWLASREVFWPAPGEEAEPEMEAVVFFCFSDPSEEQRRLRIPRGTFEQSTEDELRGFLREATADTQDTESDG
ncbi:MAG: hypothetical protein J4G03_01405 [Gemmatimonadetes bacterium]|nr:hypothetical protein [Gemmatimonadota bacterium]